MIRTPCQIWRSGMGSREWGMGSRSYFPIPHSPLPTPCFPSHNRNMFDLLDYYGARREAILKSIRELVERETKSREESRLNEIAGFVAGQLREIGGQVELIPQTGYGTNLRARFDFGHDRTERSVLVVGHLDTVWPVGALERLPFRITPAQGS